MAFDPSVIGSIGDTQADIPGSIGKAMQLRDMSDRNQLNTLQLNAAKEEAGDSAKVKNILKGSDYTTPQGLAKTAAAVNRVSPKAAMDLMKQGQQYQSGQVQQQLDQYTLAEKRQDLIVSTLDSVIAEARQLKNSGGSDLDVNALITQRMPGALQQLRSTKLPDGAPALPDDQLKMVSGQPFTLATLEGYEAKSKQGQAQIKARLEQFKADTQAKAEATKEKGESEHERHDLAMEAAGKAKAAGFSDTEADLLAALADKNVSLPAGLRSQTQIKSTVDGLLRKHPEMSPDEIAEGIKSGKLKLAAETKGAQTAGTQIGKVALSANELEIFGDQTVEASKGVPRGKFVPWNELRQMTLTKDSDPALLRFKTKMQALENAYNQLAARSGTDVDKRAHIHELFNSANSDAAVQTLVKSLKEEAVGARDAADRTIAETSGQSAIPGAGPAVPRGTTPGAQTPTAVGPNGHTLKLSPDGKSWVDAQTGGPVG
jgi:hypothetical protein